MNRRGQTEGAFANGEVSGPTRRPMTTIWKFTYALGMMHYYGAAWVVAMPKGAKVLHVGAQAENICLWAAFPSGNKGSLEKRVFRIIATGQPFNETGLSYVGTAHFPALGLVWHVYHVYAVGLVDT